MNPTATLTAPAVLGGLDEIDAHRAVTHIVADLLEGLEDSHAVARAAAEPDHQALSDAISDAGRRAEDLARIAARLARTIDGDPDPNVAVTVAELRAGLDLVTSHLLDAGADLDAACGHDCPPIPHAYPDAVAFAAELVDRLDGAGYALTRGGAR